MYDVSYFHKTYNRFINISVNEIGSCIVNKQYNALMESHVINITCIYQSIHGSLYTCRLIIDLGIRKFILKAYYTERAIAYYIGY